MARLTWQAGIAVSLGEFMEPATVDSFGYEATTAGVTGTTEPNWPLVAGNTVVDGTVTWTARTAMTITWTARPLYKTGAAEPVWPTTLGATVVDGGVTWTAQSPAITDAKCPQSKIAYAMASKVFSPYRDVTRYSTTANPRDWSTADDAGFLPTGQHSPESPEITNIAEFRGRGAFFTAGGVQLWTVDPDPAEMALFDNIEGIGTTFNRGALAVANDLYYLTPAGLRSLSIAAGAESLESGDIGSGIDQLIVPASAGPYLPIVANYPGLAQFIIAFGPDAFYLTRSRLGKVAAATRGEYPWPLEDTTQLNGQLYFRTGDDLMLVDPEAVDDDGVEFEGVIETPALDMGSPGVSKMMVGMDIVGYGEASVSIGWDQTDPAAYTSPYLLPEDSVPGGFIPIPVMAPSFAVRIVYAGGQAWKLNAMNLYLQDSVPPQ